MKCHWIQFLALIFAILLPYISSKKSEEICSFSNSSDSDHCEKGSCSDLSLFNSCFLNEVRKSSTLREMFYMKEVSPQNVASGLFYISMAEAASLGDTKSAYNAQMATRFITECTNDLTPILMSAYSNTLAKFLKSQGELNQKNACHLAHECAEAIARMGKIVMNKCIPLSKIGAIDMGVKDFLYHSIQHQELTSKDRGRFHFLFGLEFLKPHKFKDYDELMFAEQSRNNNSNSDSSEHCGIDFDFDKDLCDIHQAAVIKFVSDIITLATYSPDYGIKFDMDDIPPGQLAEGIFHLSQYHIAQRYKNSSALADNLYNVVLDYQDKYELQWEMASITGTAKYLYSRKYLTFDNAEDLAKKYLDIMKKNDAYFETDSIPQSRLVALFKTLFDFLLHLTQRDPTPTDGEDLFYHLVNEIKCMMRENSGT